MLRFEKAELADRLSSAGKAGSSPWGWLGFAAAGEAKPSDSGNGGALGMV